MLRDSGRRLCLLLAALGVLAAGSCAEQGTEIVLTVRTDFHVPEEADELRLVLGAPAPPEGGSPFSWEQTYLLGGDPGEHGMPATLAVRPGPTYRRDVTFEAVLLKGGVEIARNTSAASFRDEQRVDVELQVERIDSFACPNDPVDSPVELNVGGPCESAANCGGNFCLAEASFPGFPGGYCLGQPNLLATCDPWEGTGCAPGAKCVYMGGDPEAPGAYLCLDACAVAGTNNAAHRTNCDCRDGYACDPVTGGCLPGCTTDEECCRAWTDADGDTAIDPGETAPVADCRGGCDLASFLCAYDGAPGAVLGDPCAHESECPADSRCLPEASSGIAGGMCIRERCDLDGHACDGGSGCNDLGYFLNPYRVCVRGCEVGSGPGDPGYRCEEGQACWPAEFAPPPRDFREADGYCWTGNWSSVTVHNIYSPCTQDADCWSPGGLGACLQFEPGGPGYCVVHGCTHPDLATACAEGGGGACIEELVGLDHCVKGCTPGLEPTAAGCPAGFGCWEIGGIGFCYYACAGNPDCGGSWSCNTRSRGCEL